MGAGGEEEGWQQKDLQKKPAAVGAAAAAFTDVVQRAGGIGCRGKKEGPTMSGHHRPDQAEVVLAGVCSRASGLGLLRAQV